MTTPKCDVCCGLGTYPVINSRGRTLYFIKCPECFGSGLADEAAPEPSGLPPRSTAADITSLDQLKALQARREH